MSESEVKFFENNLVSASRGWKLKQKTSFTSESTKEFATVVKLMIKTALSTENQDYKKKI